MKTIQRNGEAVTVVKVRGMGDGGAMLCALVEEEDGTFSMVLPWYDDPDIVDDAYRNVDQARGGTYADWLVAEARWLVDKVGDRPTQPSAPRG